MMSFIQKLKNTLIWSVMIVLMTLCSSVEAKHVSHTKHQEPNYRNMLLKEYISLYCKKDCVTSGDLLKSVKLIEAKTGIDFSSLVSIVVVESKFNVKATSGKNKGLMQVNVRYHKDKIKGRNIYNVSTNLEVGSSIYKDCLDRTRSPVAALKCYNGNGDRDYVKKHQKVFKQIEQLNLKEEIMSTENTKASDLEKSTDFSPIEKTKQPLSFPFGDSNPFLSKIDIPVPEALKNMGRGGIPKGAMFDLPIILSGSQNSFNPLLGLYSRSILTHANQVIVLGPTPHRERSEEIELVMTKARKRLSDAMESGYKVDFDNFLEQVNSKTKFNTIPLFSEEPKMNTTPKSLMEKDFDEITAAEMQLFQNHLDEVIKNDIGRYSCVGKCTVDFEETLYNTAHYTTGMVVENTEDHWKGYVNRVYLIPTNRERSLIQNPFPREFPSIDLVNERFRRKGLTNIINHIYP